MGGAIESQSCHGPGVDCRAAGNDRSLLKHVGGIAWCAGIALCVGLTVWSGIEDVGRAIASVGWALALVVLVRAATVSVAGAGWWLLLPSPGRLRLRSATLLRFVREAVNTLLPLTQVGGDIVGARLATFYAVPGALAAASVVIDVLMQAATQFLFAVLGLAILIALGADATATRIAAIGLAVSAPLLAGFYVVQRRSGHRMLRFVLTRAAGDASWRVLDTVDAVYRSLSELYARRSGVAASGIVHMIGWLIGTAEVWIVLACMGHPVSLAEALVIESLVQAVRGAAFLIPSALGAQEAGLILLCGLFAIPPDQALALSLIKRAADLAIGVPGLVALQILEGGRLALNYSSREERKPSTS
jgi:putative membrane protein